MGTSTVLEFGASTILGGRPKARQMCRFLLRRQEDSLQTQEKNFFLLQKDHALKCSPLCEGGMSSQATGASMEFSSLPKKPFHLRDEQKRPDNPRDLPKSHSPPHDRAT